MTSYLVTMLDRLTGQQCRIVVQSDCEHGMQEFVDRLAAEGRIPIAYPVVINIDPHAAAHVPVKLVRL